ncbi:MAG: C39 family peptidase [Anaerolineales bacterium]
MGAIIPSIPYKSQYDSDADEFRNDCGPACLAMVLHAFGIHASTNAVYRKTEALPNRYVTVSQLMRAALSYGMGLDYFHSWTIEQLVEVVNQGRAIIALVHYGAWSQLNPGISTQNTFEGPHFVVVVGADEKNIYVNDPLWKEARRSQGFRKTWTHSQFNAAWSSNHADGNRDCSGMITQKALPTAPYGSGGWAASFEFRLDPQTIARIRAWVFFHHAPQPALNNPATVNAYLAVMGGWGNQLARHTVAEGDDLRLLAWHYYGEPAKWQVIQAFNGLNPGDAISEGDVLLIPQPLESPVPVPENMRPSGGTAALFGRLEKESLKSYPFHR